MAQATKVKHRLVVRGQNTDQENETKFGVGL